MALFRENSIVRAHTTRDQVRWKASEILSIRFRENMTLSNWLYSNLDEHSQNNNPKTPEKCN